MTTISAVPAASTEVVPRPQALAQQVVIRYVPYGGAQALFSCRDREVVLDGPAGTGKTLAVLWKVTLALLKHPGARALLCRKTNTALAATALVTLESKVLFLRQGNPLGVVFFGGSKREPAAYKFPNGSVLVIGGLDNPDKIMSGEYDLIAHPEATESTLNDWQALLSRLRNGVMPYQQLVGDCNPQGSTHWLNLRMHAGVTTRLLSRHTDNPRFWDRTANGGAGDWTDEGRAYVQDILGALSGVRRQRLLDGIWANAEGAIYADSWDAERNIIDPFPIPPEWPRYLVVDFGFSHPFVAQWWAEDGDGRLYRYRELYHTNRLVEDHARQMLALMGYQLHPETGRLEAIRPDPEPLPHAVICDHDAEDRATLERHLGMTTTPAIKTVSNGIQAVAARMRPAGDGRPRLLLVRNALVERDPVLVAAKKPCCTEEEIDGYVWRKSPSGEVKDEPLKQDDHGCDTTRYMCAHRDLQETGVWTLPSLY